MSSTINVFVSFKQKALTKKSKKYVYVNKVKYNIYTHIHYPGLGNEPIINYVIDCSL